MGFDIKDIKKKLDEVENKIPEDVKKKAKELATKENLEKIKDKAEDLFNKEKKK